MKEQLARVVRGERLSEAEAATAMEAIMDGAASPAQIGALLAALAVRGESEDEVVGFARAMRARALPLRAEGALDTCGTGGDGAGTFNISTVASLVVAACGVPVAKHGNRSASGRCGSADVLEALGLQLEAGPERVQRSFDELGWAFLFAPAFHASTRHAAAPRRELGVRTVFNLLGPLTNPARPQAQVVGVPRAELAPLLARCLQRLGVRRAWVVHGAGLDELTPCGPSQVVRFDTPDESPRLLEVRPEEAGLERCSLDELAGGGAQESAGLARRLLAGERGPCRDAVLLNAAAALMADGRAADLRAAAARAGEALDSGAAARLLEHAVECSRS